MAGHSQFKNIMHRKGAQDKKRAKLFTKIIREITVAAKSGMPDPNMNPRLRAAIATAKEANMPKDGVERAIKKASGAGDDTNYDEMRYEGYGPGGIAVIVEALTDNRNRTASDVRTAFAKYGGAMGETNSVSFQFERLGLLAYKAAEHHFDDVFEKAAEAGAENVEIQGEHLEITMSPDDFHAVREGIEKELGEPVEAHLTWRPKTLVPVEGSAAESLLKFLDVLDDNDDVQRVFSNEDISDEVLEKWMG